MITAILEDSRGNRIGSAGHEGNESFLIRDEADLGLLSELSDCGYDVFGHSDMAELLRELHIVCGQVGAAERAHIEEIIVLATRCRDCNGATLTFTPFE